MRQPDRAGRRSGELGDGPRVPQCVGGFEVDEVGNRQQRGVDGNTGEGSGEHRFRIDDRSPGRYRVEFGEQLGTVRAHQSGKVRVELGTRTAPRQFGSCRRATKPVGDLDELGELAQPSRDRDLLGPQPTRPALAVPSFIRRRDGVAYLVGQAEFLGEASGEFGVPADHVVDLAERAEKEPSSHTSPVQRGATGADQTHCGNGAAQAALVVLVLGCLQRDVVPEPFGLFVRVGMTPTFTSSAA